MDLRHHIESELHAMRFENVTLPSISELTERDDTSEKVQDPARIEEDRQVLLLRDQLRDFGFYDRNIDQVWHTLRPLIGRTLLFLDTSDQRTFEEAHQKALQSQIETGQPVAFKFLGNGFVIDEGSPCSKHQIELYGAMCRAVEIAVQGEGYGSVPKPGEDEDHCRQTHTIRAEVGRAQDESSAVGFRPYIRLELYRNIANNHGQWLTDLDPVYLGRRDLSLDEMRVMASNMHESRFQEQFGPPFHLKTYLNANFPGGFEAARNRTESDRH